MFADCFPLSILDMLDVQIPLSALNFRKERDCLTTALLIIAPNCDVPLSGVPLNSGYSLMHIPPLLFDAIFIFATR